MRNNGLIVGISGRKQSGKTTLANAVLEASRAAGRPAARLAFADPIKRFCVDVLGVDHELVYGTDEQKNEKTEYRWVDLPHWPRVAAALGANGHGPAFVREHGMFTLTVRQLLQEVGTGIFRSFHPDTPVRMFLREAADAFRGGVRLVVADDVRFPNEKEAVRSANGLLVRLARGVADDPHVSEVAVGDADGDWDLVVPAHATAAQAADLVLSALQMSGRLP